MKLTDKQKGRIINILIAFAAGGFFYFLHPLPPLLIYEYSGPDYSISVLNAGFNTATDVTIGINSGNGSLIESITHSRINGEPIINSTSKENGMMYQIPHLYPNDKITFNLIMSSNNSSLPNVSIRSDEVQGIELTQFLSNFLNYLYVLLGIVSLGLAAATYFTLSKILKKYMDRHM